MSTIALRPRFGSFGAAVDIGTTTLAVGFYSTDGTLVNKTDPASAGALLKTRPLIQNQRPDMPVPETAFGRVPPVNRSEIIGKIFKAA